MCMLSLGPEVQVFFCSTIFGIFSITQCDGVKRKETMGNMLLLGILVEFNVLYQVMSVVHFVSLLIDVRVRFYCY